MSDTITDEERQLIDRAVAEGRVTRVPRGASAFSEDWVYCGETNQLIRTDWAHLPVGERRAASLAEARQAAGRSYRAKMRGTRRRAGA